MTAPLTPRPGAPVWKVKGCTFHNGLIPVGVAVGSITEPPQRPLPRRLSRHTAEPLSLSLTVENGALRWRGEVLCDRDCTPSARRSFDRLASWARPR